MRLRLFNFFNKSIFAIYGFMMLCILILILFFQNITKYMCKQDFLFPNLVLLILGLLLLCLITIIVLKHNNKIENFLNYNNRSNKIIIVTVFSLFFLQVYFCYNFYFFTGWDADVIFNGASFISKNNYAAIWKSYYNYYPNNILITYLFSIILKINNFIGVFNFDSGIMSLITIQCMLSSISSYFVYKVIYDIKKSYILSWCSWLLYCLFVGSSQWLVIPYSDSTGLIFPILIFRLYQLQKNGRYVALKWSLITFFSFFGYNIKPQTIIVTIAIIIVLLLNLLRCKKNKAILIGISRNTLVCIAVLAFCFFSLSQINQKFTSNGVNLKYKLGFSHFLMMGLNAENDGGYYRPDVDFSTNVVNNAPEKLTEENFNIIKQRLSDYVLYGLAKHLAKKTLVNYGDGTFAWGVEGNFYSQLLPDKNSVTSPFIKDICYSNGKYYDIFSTLKEALWILILTSSMGILFMIKNSSKTPHDITILLLSIIGLTIFVLLFEARARYLYTYSPFYVILGVLGWVSIVDKARNFINRRKFTEKNICKCK